MNLIKSCSYQQQEILESIIALHTGPIEADVTYGKGCLYRRSLPRPLFCFDLQPCGCGVIPADVQHLPVKPNIFRCVMFDPPFMVKTGPGAKLKDRFGVVGRNIRDLWDFYFLAMMEICRVLRPGGWLIFKCQDVVNSGVNNFSHVVIWNYAQSVGFIPRDLFILLAKTRMVPKKQVNQRHARKYHSYFWVFQKNGGRN
ncbi:MAG: hypothetical protein C4567_07975 [Deltaproteobacteria bacterium]|nr:MAG: hypothetical protein C4567_07975 [Deltaproteobacteria bacterium]